MAKILKVKIGRNENAEHTKTVYSFPQGYDAEKIEIIAYEGAGGVEDVRARGNKEEYWIGIVSDADAPQFLELPDYEEITDSEAIVSGRLWRPQIEKIIDSVGVLKIIKNLRAGKTLTAKELDAIDPDKPEIGIGKSKLFDDLLTSVKEKR